MYATMIEIAQGYNFAQITVSLFSRLDRIKMALYLWPKLFSIHWVRAVEPTNGSHEFSAV